ncbi:MAG TPA: TonB-dependent receptor [Kofleriaceae bacterium]|nr:TonB-dependent receptor [Kofleriaceae bacterium]
MHAPSTTAPAPSTTAQTAPAKPAGPAPAPAKRAVEADDAAPADTTYKPVPGVVVSPAQAAANAAAAQAEAQARDDGQTEVITISEASPERTLLTGRAPVSVITRKDLATSGHASLGDILQALPSQANAGNAQVNAGGDGTTRLNLRGLGAARTLILLNGRRMVAGGPGADSSVDINAIPLAMIERVEVYKDGASALYGADAVGGVVNLVTRPQFDGTDVTLLTSTSQHGDGTEYDASFVSGFTTDDKTTYLVMSGGYQHHEPVFAGDRHFSAVQRGLDFATGKESHTQSLTTPGGRLDTTSIGPGGVPPPGCASTVCKPDGAGRFASFTPRDEYNDAAQDYVYTPSTRYNVFATGGNRVNAHMSIFGELLYQHRDSSRQLSPAPFDANAVISKDSIYNPLGGDIADYRRRFDELGPRHFIDQVTTVRAVVGFNGTLPIDGLEDWTYEVSYNYGSTHEKIGNDGEVFLLHAADALGPSMIVNGVPICVRTPGDPTTQIFYTVRFAHRPPQPIACVPLDPFAKTIPAAQLKNLTFSDVGDGDDSITTVLATTQGRIARLPHHGEITGTFGVDYRDERGRNAPLNLASTGDTTDNPSSTPAQDTRGVFDLSEGFAELAVVPIVGAPGEVAQRLEVDLGARVLYHNKFGGEATYKAGALFRSVQGLAARATYATAFRTPTFLDLFEGRTIRTPFVEDPCDARPPSAGGDGKALTAAAQAACSAQGVPVGAAFGTTQQTSAIGGNARLAPEKAATATIGVVYEPPQVPGLAATADYWHIHIDHAIETLSVATIFANCYERGVQAFCDQIARDPKSHRIAEVDQSPENVSSTTTSGVDLALAYDTRLAGIGRVRTSLEGQYLISYDLKTAAQTIHGAGVYDLGAFPHLRANLSSTWSHPSGASAGFTARYVGTYRECASDDCGAPGALSRDVGQYAKLDLFGGYQLPWRVGRASLEVGVNNVFNVTPPLVYNAPTANSDAATYDFVGRVVFARLEQQF